MSDRQEPIDLPRSSRQRYRQFVDDYKHRRLDEVEDGQPNRKAVEAEKTGADAPVAEPERRRGKRREYLREYIRWLRPHRYAVGALILLALLVAGLEMIEPLFMRFIVDRILLKTELDASSRLTQLHVAGAVFLAVIILSRAIGVMKDYRQRLVNVRVMLTLRWALFDRLLHLPLSNLWDMKTGGILSRLTGDVDTTT